MILLNYPILNRVLLDGNSTIIKVQSEIGATTYFRAKIYIDDLLFDEQGWSREDNFTATKDLLYLHYAYFQNVFAQSFINGLIEQPQLTKKVNITIEERLLATDQLIDTLDLDTFYIMHNVKSSTFNFTNKLILLGLETEVLRISANGKIVIPFYANTTAETITVTTSLDTDTVIDTVTLPSSTAKKAFLYTLNLDGLVEYANLFVKVSITVGAITIEKYYKTIRHPHHQVKEVVFKNNFGYFIPAYFDGEFSDESGFKVETYDNLNGSETIFAVAESKTYKIFTGQLLQNENGIVNEISNSLKCYFYNGSKYLPINTTTKKNLIKQDKTHLFPVALTFEFATGLPIDNNAFADDLGIGDIQITGDENAIIDVLKSTFQSVYTSIFSPYLIIFETLPLFGTLKVETSLGTTVVVAGQTYVWNDIVKFTFQSAINQSGIPYTNFTFKMSNGYHYSDLANAVVNINDLPDLNYPPQITVEPYSFRIRLNPTNTGTKVLENVSVVDPDNDTFTVLFEIIGTVAGAFLTNATTLTPTLNIDDTTPTFFDIRVTATDSEANVSEVIVPVEIRPPFITWGRSAPTVSGTQTTYTITAADGAENETVDFRFDYNVYSSGQYVAVNSDDIDNEIIVSLNNRRQTFTKAFDLNGEISFQITIEDQGTPPESLTITLLNATGTGEVDKESDTIIIL